LLSCTLKKEGEKEKEKEKKKEKKEKEKKEKEKKKLYYLNLERNETKSIISLI
ncbi:MAG: hypothetical protein Q9181_007206, partial [Wetmoreana brouardii]